MDPHKGSHKRHWLLSLIGCCNSNGTIVLKLQNLFGRFLLRDGVGHFVDHLVNVYRHRRPVCRTPGSARRFFFF